MTEELITIGDQDIKFTDLEQDAQVIVQRVRALREAQQQLHIQLIESERVIKAWEADLHDLVHAVEENEEESA